MDSYSSASEIPDLLQFLRPPVKTFYGHRPSRGDLDRNYRNYRFGRLREDRHRTELRSSSSLVLQETTQTSTQREYRVSRGSVTDIHYPCQFFSNHSVQPKKYAEKREQTVNFKLRPGEVKTYKKLKRINQSTRKNQTALQPKLIETGNILGVESGRKIYESRTPAHITDTRIRRHFPNDDETFARSSWHFRRVISAMKMEMKKRKMREEYEQKYARIVTGDGSPNDVPQQCVCSNKYSECIKKNTGTGHKSRVKISGQLGLTEDDKYVLRCAARIDDEPLETQCEYINTNRDSSQQTKFFSSSKPKQISVTDKSVCEDDDCPFKFRCQRTTYAQTDIKNYTHGNEINVNRKESKCIQVNLNFVLPGIEDKSNQNDALSQCNCKQTAPTETFIGHDNANTSNNPLVVISVYPKTDVVNEDSIFTTKTNQKLTSPKKLNNDKARQTSLPKVSSPKRESSPRRPRKEVSPKKELTPKREKSPKKELPPKKDVSPSRSKDVAKRDTSSRRDKTPKRYKSPIKGNSPRRDKSPSSTSSKSISSKPVPPRPQQKMALKSNKTDRKGDKFDTKTQEAISADRKNKVKTLTTTSSKLNTKQTTVRTATNKKEIGNKAKPKHSSPVKITIDSLESRKVNQTKKALVESFTRELSSHLDKSELVETIHTNTPKSTGFSNVSVNIDGPKEQYSLFFSSENFTIKKKVKNQETQKKFTSEEENSVSMVNFLIGPDEERKRSFSQTVITPIDVPPIVQGPQTSVIKVKDSIEISHRREDRAISQSVKSVTNENDVEAPEFGKHYTGDECSMDPVARDKEVRELLGVDTGRLTASNKNSSPKVKPKEKNIFPEWIDYEIFRYLGTPAAPKTKRDIKIAEILNIKPPIACQQEAKECTNSEIISASSKNDKTFNELIQQFEVYKSHNVRDKNTKERPISMSKKEFDRIKLLIHHNLSKRYNERRKLRIIKKTSKKTMAVQCTSRKINNHQISQTTKKDKRTAACLRSKTVTPENYGITSKLIQPSLSNKATSCSHYQTISDIQKPGVERLDFRKKKEILEKALQKTVFNKLKPEKRKEKPKTVVLFKEEEHKNFNTEKGMYLREQTPYYRRQPIVHISYAIMKSITFSSTSIARVAPPARGKASVKSNIGLHDLEPPHSLRNEFYERATDWMGYPKENSLKTEYSVHTLFKGKTRNRSIYVSPNTESINSMYPEEGSRVFVRPPKIKDRSKEMKIESRKPLLRRLWSYLVMRTTKDIVTKENSLEKLSTNPSVSLDSYHLNTSIDPRDISSSMYDTTASFYTNHSIRAVPNRMKKKTFFGIFKVLR